MKTFSPKPEHIDSRWYVVDADGQILGRLAAHIASILRGKHKPIFAPHADTGDHVIVVNASKVRLTGTKLQTKEYHRHSGYPGGLRSITYERLMATRPELAVEKAVRGMLPKNRLGRTVGRKLAVYAGPEHRHAAQKPVTLAAGEVPPWTGLPAPKPKPEPAPAPEERRRLRRRTAEEAPARGARAAKAAPKGSAKSAPAKSPKRAPSKRASARPSAKAAAKAAPRKKAASKRSAKKES